MQSQRLLRLAAILAQCKDAIGSGGAPVAVANPASLPMERIRQLTSELLDRGAAEIDAIDGVTMRLLLIDYTSAVRHFRAGAERAGAGIEAASLSIAAVRRLLRREQKHERRGTSTEPAMNPWPTAPVAGPAAQRAGDRP